MIVSTASVAPTLAEHHYLGAAAGGRGLAWRDEHGIIVIATPTAKALPSDWAEVTRWCLDGTPNAGSRQWAAFVRWARGHLPASTIVSYSDRSRHSGALYRACGFLWAPTWPLLVTPPSGGGYRGGKPVSVKDRWIYPLRPDPRRAMALQLEPTYRRRFPEAEYREPVWKHGRPLLQTGGGRYPTTPA
jgi:hypothetical protein